jgi:hypothetical protein
LNSESRVTRGAGCTSVVVTSGTPPNMSMST